MRYPFWSIFALTLLFSACTSTRGSSHADPDGGNKEPDPVGTKDGGGVPEIDAWVPHCECSDTQVCVDGECEDLPEHCPCPVESYCDLSTSSCVVGCTDDSQCSTGRICDDEARRCKTGCREDSACGSGRICENLLCQVGCRTDSTCGSGNICDDLECRPGCRRDSTCAHGSICDDRTQTCRAGCRHDADCGSTGICDTTTYMCRMGCRSDSDCPSEQICNEGAALCETGCTSDDGCNEGRICESDRCVDGCRSSAGCGHNQYCDVPTRTCHAGCAPDGSWDAPSTRCDVGESCVPRRGCGGYGGSGGTGNCDWQCSATQCWTDCVSDPAGPELECLHASESRTGAACRQSCTSDSSCSGGDVCHWFKVGLDSWGINREGACGNPCTADTDCSDAVDYSGHSTPSCICSAGHCMSGGYACYHTRFNFGL